MPPRSGLRELQILLPDVSDRLRLFCLLADKPGGIYCIFCKLNVLVCSVLRPLSPVGKENNNKLIENLSEPFLSVRSQKSTICSVVVVVMGFLRKSLATIEAVSWLGVVVLVGEKKKKK